MFTLLSLVVVCVSCISAKSLYSVHDVKPVEYEKFDELVPRQTPGNLPHEIPALHTARTKRSVAEECEEMELCKLHARSGHSLLAAFQLYFVNKENAKLWDHQQHTMSDCEQRFQGCNGGTSEHVKQTKKIQFVDNNSIDDDNNDDDDVGDDY